jgi:hypothetical protein
MKIVFSGDIFVLLNFRGSHVPLTYIYASTVFVKQKSHPEAACRPKFNLKWVL